MTTVKITKCDNCNNQIPDDSKTAVRLSSTGTTGILIRVGARVGNREKFDALDFCNTMCTSSFLTNVRDNLRDDSDNNDR